MMLAFVAAMLVAVSCGSKKGEPQQKVLVIYYSQTATTKAVAQELATKLGADIEEIVPVTPYEGDFQATILFCGFFANSALQSAGAPTAF